MDGLVRVSRLMSRICPHFQPLHRYTVCIPPEFRDQLANTPPSRVQIKTSEIGVISFRYLGADNGSQRDEEKILV